MPEPIKTKVKPSDLSAEDFSAQAIVTPAHATQQRTLQAPAEQAKPPQVIAKEPLQGTFTKEAAKAIRREALEQEKTIGDFLTDCFNVYMRQKQ